VEKRKTAGKRHTKAMTPSRTPRISNMFGSRKGGAILFALIFATIGTALILLSHASTPGISTVPTYILPAVPAVYENEPSFEQLVSKQQATIAYRTVEQKPPTSPLTDDWVPNGRSFFYTTAASDWDPLIDPTTHQCTGNQIYLPTSYAQQAAGYSGFKGFYMHEVVTHSAQCFHYNGTKGNFDWQGAVNDSTQVNWNQIEAYVSLAYSKGQKVIWSEPAWGWPALNGNPTAQAKFASWKSKYPNTLVPMFATNWTGTASKACGAPNVSSTDCIPWVSDAMAGALFNARAYGTYPSGTNPNFGESVQSWNWRDRGLAPTRDGATGLINYGFVNHANYFAIEGEPNLDMPWGTDYMNGISDFSTALATNGGRSIASSQPAGTVYVNTSQTWVAPSGATSSAPRSTAGLNNLAPQLSGWAAWDPLGGYTNDSPAAVSWGSGRLDTIYRAADTSAIMHKWYAGSWQGWESQGAPNGVALGSPAISSWGSGRLDMFARGSNNQIYWKKFDGGWSSWMALPSLSTAYTPAAVSWGSGRIDLFAVGSDQQAYHLYYSNGVWSRSWELLGGKFISGLSVASWGSGHLDIFGVATDHAVWHKYYSGGWYGWYSLGGYVTATPSAVASGYGHIFLVATSSDQHIYIKEFNAATVGWGDWGLLGGTTASGPSIASWAQGRLDLFERGLDNQIYHTAVQLSLQTITPPPPDYDHDGAPDSSDPCPYQAGPSTNNYCPVHAIKLYHYYNPYNYDSFYTTTRNDAGYAYYGWGFASCEIGVWDGNNGGMVPLWRYYNSTGGDHFYTIDRNDAGYSYYGYGFEGQEGWVYPPNTSSALKNIFRYFAGGWIVDHYYGIDPYWSYPNYNFERVEAQGWSNVGGSC
jgi:hypothetical protein